LSDVQAEEAARPAGGVLVIVDPATGQKHRTRRNSLVAVAACALGGLVLGAVARSDTLAQNAKIVFAGPKGIYTINPDGSGQKLIHRTTAQAPAWSPNGKQIVVVGQKGLTVLRADGTHPVLYKTTGVFPASPAWSPDGKRIAFAAQRPGGVADLYVLTLKTKGVAQLTKTPQVIEVTPSWSPDGTRILFGQIPRSIVFPPTVLRSVSPSGRSLRLVSNLPAGQAVWSPDGTRIAFAGALSGEADIWVLNANGTGLTDLTPNFGGGAAYPAWSPDGSKIAFQSGRGDQHADWDIWVMNADGSDPTRLTNFDLGATTEFPGATHPSWQPLA
jgi:TolB protein